MLWAYRTIKRIPTGETPFSLAYGMEAVNPVDFYMPNLRIGEIYQDHNAIQLCLAEDQSEKRRRKVQIRIAVYQQQIKAYHHKKVKAREFQVGDLVLSRVIQRTKERNAGKLGPNWEGPYIVLARGGNDSYTLVDQARKTFGKK